jgi:hypothetical protein
VHRQQESTLGHLRSCIIAFVHYCSIGLRQLIPYIHLLNHLLAVVLATTLPGAFIFLAGEFPHFWAARHQNLIVNLLHLCLFAGFVHQNFSFQESVVAALAMVSFDMFQRALGSDAKTTNESDHQLHESSAAETLVQLSCSAPSTLTKSDSPTVSPQERSDSGVSNVKSVAEDPKEDIVRLQGSLTDLKTANKAKEVLLRRTREELKNARETLNETFAEYCALRDEIKNIKQNMAREHQAVVYRKDIELFALRKGNEQKEKYIKEHDAKLDEVFQQQKATVELKDAQLKMLKERLAFLDRQGSPRFGQDQDKEEEEGDHALQVRLLRVKTAGNTTTFESPSVYEAKDATIVSLREQLAVAKKAADEVVNQQAELARAWDVVKNVQASLKEERKLHAQTREKLHEITVRLEEEQQKNGSSPVDRLPTIEEDKEELEAIFDTTQEDNVRLNAELEALEKRLREANSRMFDAEQEVVALREQVQAEKAVSSDLETARPSVVHRVHFQRMEGQLKDSQDALRVREKEVELLKNTLIGKNDYVKDLLAEVDAAVAFHTQDQDEIERLKQNVAELQATKDHLMRDHERLALQRTRTGTRQRVSSTERASARSSDATLIQELSPLPRSTEEAPQVEALPSVPAIADSERPSSIQETPKRHIRSESTPNRWSLMSNAAPPPELRGVRRRSLGLKDLMKKMVNREDKTNTTTDTALRKSEDKPRKSEDKNTAEPPKPRTALSTKDKNTTIRPATAAPLSKTDEAIMHDPFFTGPAAEVPVPQGFRPANVRRHTPRYYAEQDDVKEQKQEERPQTAMGSKDDSTMSKSLSRRSWGAAT